MTLSELRSQTRFLTNTDSTSYSDTDLDLNLTRWAHLLTGEIINSQDDWDFQGEIATADLVANQREYTFPVDILKIKRIELKLDGTNWVRAAWLDEAEISRAIASEEEITEQFNNSEPFVALFNKSFFIFSGTITAVTGGIKIWYLKEIVGKDATGADITSFSASTDKPNINEAFQRGLCYGAAKDWYQKYGFTVQARDMDIELEKVIVRMKEFYGRRSEREIRFKTASSLEAYE